MKVLKKISGGRKLICAGMLAFAASSMFAASFKFGSDSDLYDGTDNELFASYGDYLDQDFEDDSEDEFKGQEEVFLPAKSADDERVERLLDVLSNSVEARLKGRSYADSVADKISGIESLKQQVADLLTVKVDQEQERRIQLKMEAEISERMDRKPRAAEMNPDGSLNERGMLRLENDIERIKEKYEGLSKANAPDAETLRKAEALRDKIAVRMDELDAVRFSESSLQESGVYFYVAPFTNSKGVEGWPYTVSYEIDGNEVAVYSGILTYEDISGKKTPSVPSLRDSNYDARLKTYENFLDSVEVFDAAFGTGVDFIEAVISGKVEIAKEPSSYKISVDSLVLKNVATGKTICTYNLKDSAVYQADPAIDVEVERKGRKNAAPVTEKPYVPERERKQPKQLGESEEKKVKKDSEKQRKQEDVKKKKEEWFPTWDQDSERHEKKELKEDSKKKDENKSVSTQVSDAVLTPASKLSGKKTTYGSVLYFLPGTLNAYFENDTVHATLGYSFTYGVKDHFFVGFNAEVEPGCAAAVTYDYCMDGKYYGGSYSCDEPMNFVFTGVAGWNWNWGPAIRMSAFTEAGFMFDKFAAGAGLSMEIASLSSNVALQTSVANYLTSDLTNITKASVGVEILF